MTIKRSSHPSRGFALMEVLLAAGVLGFGLLALAGLEFNLFGNSDLSKQRSEAVQLGEQKVEDLRSFSTNTIYGNIANSSDTVTGTSATFTRTWTVTNSAITVVGGAYPIYKDVQMIVTWTGRNNAPESITLNSILAMSDPASAGLASVPPAGTPTRKPKNRNINIPWPAVKLGGTGTNATSGFRPPGSATGFAIIFNDVTGAVTQACTSASLPGTDNISGTPTSTVSWGCTAVNGWFMAGYIGVSSSNPPPINFHITLTVTTGALYGCWDDIGTAGTGTQLYTGYVAYSCVVTTSGGVWSGTSRFTGQTFASTPVTVTWGTTNAANMWKICRYNSNGATYPFSNISTSIENENYILRDGNSSACPTGTSQSYP